MVHESASTRGTTAIPAAAINRGPQPGWMTLNEARERSFTGEIAFEVQPEVRVYLDNGIVYFAERSTDVALGRRLVEAGLLDHEQLERGTVRVGEVEHLGRLFDRETSIDRDAVLVAAETATEILVAEIANDAFCTVRSTAYRHHPSGLHRWFAPASGAAADRRFGGPPSHDAAVLDDVPGLPLVSEQALADHLYIEWDEPVIGGMRPVEEESLIDEFDESLLQAMLDESALQYDIVESDDVSDTDRAVETSAVQIEYLDVDDFESPFDTPSFEARAFDEPVYAATGFAVPASEVVEPLIDGAADRAADDEFMVIWPSGADDVTTAGADTTDDTAWALADARHAEPLEHEPIDAEVADTGSEHDEQATDEPADDLAVTPIEIWNESIIADVPADVSDAVKRAIAALERITQETPVVPPILQPSEFDDRHAPVVAKPTGFAPPTQDMSVEAIYARASAQMDAEADADVTDPVAPTSGVVSVVFLDDVATDEAADESHERTSALRRLIGGLRRKDR